jgi:hypothetical protein
MPALANADEIEIAKVFQGVALKQGRGRGGGAAARLALSAGNNLPA